MQNNDNFWTQFRTKDEVLRDWQYERHIKLNCVDNCPFCEDENEVNKAEKKIKIIDAA
jgi:hypothetical protein